MMDNKVFDVLHKIYQQFEHTTLLSECVELAGYPEVYYAKYVSKNMSVANQSTYYIYENEPKLDQLSRIQFKCVFTIINGILYMYELPHQDVLLKRKIITSNFNIEFVDNN